MCKETVFVCNDLLVAVSDFYRYRFRREMAVLPSLLKNPIEGDIQALTESSMVLASRRGTWSTMAGFVSGRLTRPV